MFEVEVEDSKNMGFLEICSDIGSRIKRGGAKFLLKCPFKSWNYIRRLVSCSTRCVSSSKNLGFSSWITALVLSTKKFLSLTWVTIHIQLFAVGHLFSFHLLLLNALDISPCLSQFFWMFCQLICPVSFSMAPFSSFISTFRYYSAINAFILT